jgi:hypothetical protein
MRLSLRIASKASPWADLPHDHQRFSPTRRALGIRATGSAHTYLHWGEYRVRQGAAGDQ